MDPRRRGILLRLLLFGILLSRQALALDCLQPFVPENGHVVFNGPGPYPPGTLAKYSCALGFDRVGREDRTCRPDGTWSGQAPACAIDVAQNKPNRQSSGRATSPLSRGFCTITQTDKRSWWEVDLLGVYSVQSVALRMGKQTSPLTSIQLITNGGDFKQCDIEDAGPVTNSTVSIPCSHDDVIKVRLITASRLHLCEIKVFATNAVSAWQCAQGSMDVVGVLDGMCYAASRDEQADWPGAQRKCLDRGGSLPLRMNEAVRRGLRYAVDGMDNQKPFYWIGATSSSSEWRWADGDGIGFEADWPMGSEPSPRTQGVAEGVLMARGIDWHWVAIAQNTWNAFLCQSRPKFCASPGVGEASRVVFSSNSYAIGTFCFYSCEEGFDLIGDSQRECEEGGRWSGEMPQCKRRDCGHEVLGWKLGTVTILNGSTEYQNQIQYDCSTGKELHGEKRRMCTMDGTWSGSEPQCKDIDCGRPPQISFGKIHYNSTVYNAVANYSCVDGYQLIGHDAVFCGEKGHWEPNSPVCYDLATIRHMKGGSESSSWANNVFLCLFALGLVGILMFAVQRITKKTSAAGIAPMADKFPGQVIYATPQLAPSAPGANTSDPTVIYYASCNAVTQMEVPPHLLSLQQLPNGNIHVTLPVVAGRPMVRPGIPHFSAAASPTPSQLLYSFDHEPIYDIPPDINGTMMRATMRDENHYERLPDAPPPPLPKAPPPPL